MSASLFQRWLEKAAEDLVVARLVLHEEHTAHACFLSQQCIEKSLKALIEEYEIGSVRIHNLERLFEIVAEQTKLDVDPVLVAMLDKLYIDARYPGD